MNEEKINIAESESFERKINPLFCRLVAMSFAYTLGCYENLFSFQSAITNSRADMAFTFIGLSCIDVTRLPIVYPSPLIYNSYFLFRHTDIQYQMHPDKILLYDSSDKHLSR